MLPARLLAMITKFATLKSLEISLRKADLKNSDKKECLRGGVGGLTVACNNNVTLVGWLVVLGFTAL